MPENESPCKVEFANKLIERARKMNATCLLISLAVLFAVTVSLDGELTDNPSEGLSLFGVKFSYSFVSLLGPIAILGAQAVSLMYIAAMAKLLLLDKSLFGKISEPWILLYPHSEYVLWFFVGIVSFLFPLLSLIVTQFVGIDNGGEVGFLPDVTLFDVTRLLISVLIAVRSVWLMWNISLVSHEIFQKN